MVLSKNIYTRCTPKMFNAMFRNFCSSFSCKIMFTTRHIICFEYGYWNINFRPKYVKDLLILFVYFLLYGRVKLHKWLLHLQSHCSVDSCYVFFNHKNTWLMDNWKIALLIWINPRVWVRLHIIYAALNSLHVTLIQIFNIY